MQDWYRVRYPHPATGASPTRSTPGPPPCRRDVQRHWPRRLFQRSCRHHVSARHQVPAAHVSPNDRRLYAFEAKGRYGVLAPFMGEHLDRKLIEANWDDVQRVITAFRNRVVAPSLILRKLGTMP